MELVFFPYHTTIHYRIQVFEFFVQNWNHRFRSSIIHDNIRFRYLWENVLYFLIIW